MKNEPNKPVIATHPEVPAESKSDRKTLIVRFDPPGGLSGDADEQVRQCVQRIQTILQAYEATLRKTDGARHEAYVDLPRKEAAAFRLRLLETPDIADARFEDVTKPADEELGEGE